MHTKVVTGLMSLLLAAAGVFSAPPPAYPADYSAPPQYQFEYKAEDEYAALQFGQEEQRDGAETSGEYRVLLPDGCTQTVTYTVLGERGFEADVSYDGEPSVYQAQAAVHKPEQPAAYRAAPVYKPRPAPVYHARPVYGPAPVYGARHYGQRARTYTLQSAAEGAAEEVAAEEEEVEVEVEEAEAEAAVEEAEAEVEESEAAVEEAEAVAEEEV